MFVCFNLNKEIEDQNSFSLTIPALSVGLAQ